MSFYSEKSFFFFNLKEYYDYHKKKYGNKKQFMLSKKEHLHLTKMRIHYDIKIIEEKNDKLPLNHKQVIEIY